MEEMNENGDEELLASVKGHYKATTCFIFPKIPLTISQYVEDGGLLRRGSFV